MTKIADLRREIEALEIQKCAKERELRQLQDAPTPLAGLGAGTVIRTANLRPEEKVALFLDLFGARRDVYPKLWENSASGKKGYSPAYEIDHRTGAPVKRFLPLDGRAVEAICAAVLKLGHMLFGRTIPASSLPPTLMAMAGGKTLSPTRRQPRGPECRQPSNAHDPATGPTLGFSFPSPCRPRWRDDWGQFCSQRPLLRGRR
jgi:hypothetical protein